MVSKTYYKTKDYCKVTFCVSPANAGAVEVLGLNNDWSSPLSMRKGKDGSFSVSIQLPRESVHEFKYLFDKMVWESDPMADGEVPNPFGTTNSVLSV
ncbi:MAG: isoamylase early set domain-containing protein [bacterium]|jgi:1,4-alpha-glucan branching enzyme